ncbi:hypothetical protein MMC13_007899 [Lambiella insularis]|nr:hypothetical protein [Lambiella insularis]
MAEQQRRLTEEPLSIGVLLFPHFQALDVFGPLDALNILSESRPLTLSLIAPTLDPQPTSSASSPTSPSPTFTQLILPTHTYATAPPLDVLLVPGGPGARAPTLEPAVEYIRHVYPRLKYLISVCTGAVLVARSGCVDGKRGTTNKRAWEWVTGQRKGVRWVQKARWVSDGVWWSSSGVSAGIDVAFAWMAKVWGQEVAEEVAAKMEYSLCEDSRKDPFAALYGLDGGEWDGDEEGDRVEGGIEGAKAETK